MPSWNTPKAIGTEPAARRTGVWEPPAERPEPEPRIADSIGKQVASRSVKRIHLVGGAVRVPDAPDVISRYLGIPTVGYPHSELVTPFGIAMS